MGGSGSGGSNRRHRGIVEDEIRVSVSDLHKHGCLADGAYGEVRWPSRGCAVSIRGLFEAVSIEYEANGPDQLKTSHKEPVHIVWTSKHYGGRQPYFLCPSCSQRAIYLYRLSRFVCRRCRELVYASTQERDGKRGLRRARKLRASLGASGDMSLPVWQKPKGMHWSTFDRRKATAEFAEYRYWVDLGNWLKRQRRHR